MSEANYNKKSNGRGLAIAGGIVALLVFAAAWTFVEWGINRVYVQEGYSLRLRYKGPPLPFMPGYNTPESRTGFAKVDENGNVLEKGVLREMLGPGRHFKSPFYWERELVPDVVVEAGEIAIATSKIGKQLPAGEFLVDGDLDETEYKGVIRKVFGPGRYRVNDYAYEFKKVKTDTITSGTQTKYSGWVEIPTGYVGVVTNLADNPETGAKKGIQEDVFPPGIYPINGKEQQIDIVEIGFREKSIKANLQMNKDGSLMYDQSGEPLITNDDSGISFPSNDGFPINMDFTAIWGITPDQAPNVIRKFGNVDAVESKVVGPQIESICRNIGSKYGAVDLLVGESRQEFQETTSEEFRSVLLGKDVTLLYGLVRHIYIPQEVRLPIQQAFIADELTLTRTQEQETAKTEANLREEEQKVELEAAKITVETDKLIAKQLAEGKKTAEETGAETQKLVAQIDREISLLEAQATVLLGEATAKATQIQEEAKAEKFQLAVEAFGSGEAYNMWVFASELPDDIELNLIFAGDGTFWTDLKGFSETMLGREAQQNKKK